MSCHLLVTFPPPKKKRYFLHPASSQLLPQLLLPQPDGATVALLKQIGLQHSGATIDAIHFAQVAKAGGRPRRTEGGLTDGPSSGRHT